MTDMKREAERIAHERGLKLKVRQFKALDGKIMTVQVAVRAPEGKMLRKVEKYGLQGRTAKQAVCRDWESALDAVRSVLVVENAEEVVRG